MGGGVLLMDQKQCTPGANYKKYIFYFLQLKQAASEIKGHSLASIVQLRTCCPLQMDQVSIHLLEISDVVTESYKADGLWSEERVKISYKKDFMH